MSEQTPLLSEKPPATAPPPSYQAQPGAYPPAQPATTTVVVAPQPTVVMTPNFGDCPMQVKCPNCQRDVLTNVEFTPGLLTWLVVGVLFLLGFWLGCCLIPLCIDSLKNVNHTCPSCGHMIGTYKRL